MVAALLTSSGVGVGSRFFNAGKVASRAGTVVVVVTVLALFNQYVI